jgi:hypothetical protein
MSQVVEIKRIRDDAFQAFAYINRGQLRPHFHLSADIVALTVISLMTRATPKHLSLRTRLLAIGLVYLVQRGDDVDLATLSAQDATTPRQK